MRASVIICAHNPREEFLSQTLAALERQTLSRDEWELILVDNASTLALKDRFRLTWQPHSQHIYVAELGLTPARLQGIAAAQGELIIFVDDDNVLDENYLSEALSLAAQYPFLGAWGGSIEGRFEQPPAPWTTQYHSLLAVRSVHSGRWSNDTDNFATVPFGAGLCVRKSVVDHYVNALRTDTTRRKLDRCGASLVGGGDIDLAFTSSALGLGWGVFPSLKLAHLIPKERLELKYLMRIGKAAAMSFVLLQAVHGKATTSKPRLVSIVAKAIGMTMRRGVYHGALYLAQQRGFISGIQQCKSSLK